MRRLVKILGWLFAGIVLALAALPFWLGFALVGIGRIWNTTFQRYERVGYDRFALHQVILARPEVTVTVERVEADTPVLYLWRRLTGNRREFLVGAWKVEVPEKSGDAVNPPSTAHRDSGWTSLQPRLRRIAGGLDRWLPKTRLGPGTVRWFNGGLMLTSGVWENRTLRISELGALIGNATAPARWPKADVAATFPVEAETIRVTAHDLIFDETLAVESKGADIAGELRWEGQRAAITSRFAATGWVPIDGDVQASAWQVPGARLKLGDSYAAVRGNTHLEWHEGKIILDVDAKGEPAAGQKAPPLEVQLKGHGDPLAMTLETVKIVLPGIAAQLSEPVTVGRDGQLQAGSARFSLEADLAKQPWFKASGTVRGGFVVDTASGRTPAADFNLTAKAITFEDWAIAALETKGRFDWPKIQINSATLTPAGGEQLAFRGGWDLKKKEVFDAKLSGEIRRNLLARWLPKEPGFDRVSVDAQAAGPLLNLAHFGTLKVNNVTIGGLKPLGVSGGWTGHGAIIDKFNGVATSGKSSVTAEGAIERDHLQLEKLTLQQGEAERMHLAQPAVISWRPSVQIQQLRLVGNDASIEGNLQWGTTGRVELTAKKLVSSWFGDIVPLAGPPWSVSSLEARGAWNQGPMEISLQGNGTIELTESREAIVSLVARGDKNGLRVESLRVAEETSPIVSATGALGLVIFPAQEPLVRIAPDSPLSLQAVTEPNAAFWQRLKELTGLELKDPQVSARLAGTFSKPQGEVQLEAERVAADPQRFKWAFPTVEALKVHLTGDTSGVKLDAFSVNVEGQAIKASGRLTVKEGRWRELFGDPLLVARRDTDLHVEIPDAELAPLARYVPGYLAPQGHLQADLKFNAGGTWEGRLQLRDAASRPLGPLGVLQDVSADVRLVGYTMQLESVTAKAGGQPVTLTGKVEVPLEGAPRFDLALKGENLPFVRQTGLLLRGDLDLKLETPANSPGRISGSVTLRDSLFLEDVRSMIPGGPRGSGRRPPYFSVETPPLSGWLLDVNLRGDRFLRLRTTVFSGVASARFRLLGTLGDPRAIGEATIDEGLILLPFASFSVQQGRVSLTEAQPFEPQLYVTSTSRRYGYDVRMEINGTASTPNLVFTSSPPLDSEQVLLMVMAGETPRNEVTYTGNQRFARIGAFLGQSLLNNLGADVASADRLSISTGDKVSRQGRETYNIEYQLDPKWSVVGEYDEFDDYNAGLKWRFYSKAGKDDVPKK